MKKIIQSGFDLVKVKKIRNESVRQQLFAKSIAVGVRKKQRRKLKVKFSSSRFFSYYLDLVNLYYDKLKLDKIYNNKTTIRFFFKILLSFYYVDAKDKVSAEMYALRLVLNFWIRTFKGLRGKKFRISVLFF